MLGWHRQHDGDDERRQRQAEQQLHADPQKRVLEQDPVQPSVVTQVGEPERRGPIRGGRPGVLECRVARSSYSSSRSRMATATAAARSDTPSFS